MATKTKRINLSRETMFYGKHGAVYMTALDVTLRGGDKDPLRGEPTVMLIPVDRKAKAWYDRSLDVPPEDLDELIQSLEILKEEADK